MLNNACFVKRSMTRKVTACNSYERLLLLPLPGTSCLPSSPHLLHTSIPSVEYMRHPYIKEQNNATPSLLFTIEQHELCVASISRRHCGAWHSAVPHNKSKVTCLAVYSNILLYGLDEASSNAVSSEGGIVAKYLFSCCCLSSA